MNRPGERESTRDVVLVGGGHSHVQVLRRWAMRPPPDVRLTLVVDVPVAVYSGMVPGFVAGQYAAHDLEIDVVPLARRAGARVILSRAVGVDPEARRVKLEDRPAIRYDVASFDIGSSVRGLDLPGIRDHAVPTRPIGRFVERIDAMLDSVRSDRAEGRPGNGALRVLVVGAGAGGVELAFTLETRLAAELDRPVELRLVEAGERILRGYPTALVNRVIRSAEERGIAIELGRRVVRAERNGLHFENGQSFPYDLLVWVTGATAYPAFAGSGLATDPRGFLLTRPTLQVHGHDDLFAVGDCATLSDHPETAKAGVYAVRQGPVLARNLEAWLAGRPLESYRPQSDFLTLLNLGDGTALGSKWGRVIGGRWVMRLKDWIDRRFMRRFQVLAPDGGLSEEFAALPGMAGGTETSQITEMLCGGCAAKLGQSALNRALARLEPAPDDATVRLGLQRPDDAAAWETPSGQVVVSSLDAFRAFTDDPYLLGRIAAVNAASDLQAKGADPRYAQALVSLPSGRPDEENEETLAQILAGARSVFDGLGTTLLGGHTLTSPEILVGFQVEGLLDRDTPILTLDRLEPGQTLVLTKPLGTGVLFHADMKGLARGTWVRDALASMQRHNGDAARIARRHGATAATDVTGFGLAGHLAEMAKASGVTAIVEIGALPALPGALELLARGERSTAHEQNAHARRGIAIDAGAGEHPAFDLLFDPQTSGGLVFGVPEERAASCLAELEEAAPEAGATVIGQVVRAEAGSTEAASPIKVTARTFG